MTPVRRFIIEFKGYPLWLRLLLPVSGVLLVAALMAKILLFPDHPLVFQHGAYIGKYGAVHSREAFELFRILDWLHLLSAPAFFAAFACTIFYAKSAAGDRHRASMVTGKQDRMTK